MLKFTGELEDVCFLAVRNEEEGYWKVKLFPSEQALKDFPEKTQEAYLKLNDLEMEALLFLMASNGDGESEMETRCYKILEDKLTGLPNYLRPIP